MAGIYIHIPFCRQACHYCDFHFSTSTALKDKMVRMICRELQLQKDYLGRGTPIKTIYFGGGTPSLLSAEALAEILETISLHYPLELEETTIETNPDDLNPAMLQSLKTLGFDRLSIGIQSFSEEVLRFYNRAHTATESLKSIDLARKMGFDKLSIDLMYGFPAKDHQLWNHDLRQAIQLAPGHISSYCLTIEPDTALGKWAQKGSFNPASEDFCAEQFEVMQNQLEDAGYVQYEISNFGKPDAFAVHNSNYWKGIPYLGIGPSAHSFDGRSRQHNIANNPKYIKALDNETVPFEKDVLSQEDILNEYLLTALRTIWGVDLQKVKETFGVDLMHIHAPLIQQLSQEKLIETNTRHLRLTKQGKLLADYIAGKLFV
ncbi:radical SAM family heme chaperone HemW [Echinicola vietnamensis]|uniref:Heme chaperone HemW n=1 Tax=Echinicola vietnamensis (strain DSM 17526 / LMG 23754 / KMM 6221) TaxID=926556 RepID=L0FVW6_ECHVK|nr:radical SAM family heme chaperone HemW [Echinicola vietnamensis]AGA76906.1 putative oxygen-independent coproporphyrinogen III oxidase [Echinicola vietnamensis DSM 17526]